MYATGDVTHNYLACLLAPNIWFHIDSGFVSYLFHMAFNGFTQTRVVDLVDKQTKENKKKEKRNKKTYYKENVSFSWDEAEKQLNNTVTHLKSKRSITRVDAFLSLEIRLLWKSKRNWVAWKICFILTTRTGVQEEWKWNSGKQADKDEERKNFP